MIHVETHFASELVALGSVRRDADDPGWRTTCRTASQEALSFPRRAFVVTPAHSRATPGVLRAGLVSFARPEVEYTRQRIDPAGEQSDWLWLRQDLREELVGPSSSGRSAWLRPVSPGQLLLQRGLHALARANGARGLDPAVIESRALELVHALRLREAPAPSLQPRGAHRRLRIQRVLEALAAEPGRRRSTAELAELAGLTPSHFCVVFRRESGRTVSEVLADLRLCTALDRLSERAADLSDLALELGFSSHAHFSARFRRHFGCTPSEARTRIAGRKALSVR